LPRNLITETNNGYVITVKKNKPKLYNTIKQQTEASPLDAWSWKQKGHGHPTQCRIKVWDAPKSIHKDWNQSLKRFISVRRIGRRNGKEFDTTTYYITSETDSAYMIAKYIRGHRKIENNLHWTKDVILNEDVCGIKQPSQAATLGILRNISFNLLTLTGFKSITEGIDAMGEKIDTLWETINNTIQKIKIF
jgi:predicted transposase YbfD/YdcC